MNYSLVKNTVIGEFEIAYKFTILFSLLQGMWTSMSYLSLLLLTITAFLTGLNLSLIAIKVRELGGFKNFHIAIGGSSLLGMAGSGCASCGLPILSLLGLSGSIVNIPFQGYFLSYVSIAILLVAFLNLLKSGKKNNCSLKTVRLASQASLTTKSVLEY